MLKKPKPVSIYLVIDKQPYHCHDVIVNQAKKGLGAQKVTRDFKKLEEEAQKADEMQEKFEGKAFGSSDESPEDTVEQIENMHEAYEDLAEKQKVTAQKLKMMDPKKADQIERLGMGVGNVNSTRSGVSHNAVSDFKIEQSDPKPLSKNISNSDNYSRSSSRDVLGIERDILFMDLGLESSSKSTKYKDSFDDYGSKSSSKDLDGFEDLFPDQPSRKDRLKPQIIESIAPLEPERETWVIFLNCWV